jgi:predicted O-methyltransferase YrrM
LFYLLHFSNPPTDRAIYQAVHRRRIQRIIELGVGTGQRAVRLIEVASRHFPASQISYTGLDPFEARRAEDGPGLTLKRAHHLLHATGARIRLVPGDPLSVFSAKANELGVADLVLIGWPVDRGLLPRTTYYLRRMLHDGSLVLLEDPMQPSAAKAVKILSLDRIDSLAATYRKAA